MTHPIVRTLFDEKRRQGVTFDQLAERSGVTRSGLVYWQRNARMPSLANIEAALNVLGYELVVVPKRKEG